MPISASSTSATTITPDDRIWPERARSMVPLLRERAAAIEAERELTADVLEALTRELFPAVAARARRDELRSRCSPR